MATDFRTPFKKFLTGAFVTSAFILAGISFFAYSSLPKTKGIIAVKGLLKETQLKRDQKGIVYIEANTLEDAMYTLGYAHAQDRLFQMELMRRAGSGRLSEIFGEKTLDYDRYIKTLGFERAADETYARTSPAFKATLDAYAKGVNSYLETHQGALSMEFYLLRFHPSPWRPQDAFLWGKLMALDLSHNWKEDLLRARIMQKPDGAEKIKKIWPQLRKDTLTTLEYPFEDIFSKTAKKLPETNEGTMASNAFVLSGSKTNTGKPLLANDPHLKLTLPSTWYLAHIKTKDGAVRIGATAPGVPLLILGHNGKAAWGFTTTTSDVQDLFIEKISDQKPSEYVTPHGSEPFTTRDEMIKVKGRTNDVKFSVRSTRHGVVISDYAEEAADILQEKHVLALAWPGLDMIDPTLEGLFDASNAQNWSSFSNALRKIKSPQQNVHYADTDGNIGFYAPGLVPIRQKGNGTLPVPGWTGEYDYRGYIPFDHLPQSYNPSSARIANANNKVVSDDYPYFLGTDFDNPPSRALRLDALLNQNPTHSMASFKAIQNDILNLPALEIKNLLKDIRLKEDENQRILRDFLLWDGNMDRQTKEPLVYVSLMRQLHLKVLKPYMGEEFYNAFMPNKWRIAALKSILLNGKTSCSDLEHSEAEQKCLMTVKDAFESACIDLRNLYGPPAKWRYGAAHKTLLNHPVFSEIPLIDRYFNLRYETDGGYSTLNKATPEIFKPAYAFKDTNGPGFRGIYDLSNLENSEFIIVPGQSGHPFSKNWSDLGFMWRDGRYLKLNPRFAQNVHTLTLVPREES